MNTLDHGVNVMGFEKSEKEWFERKFYYPPLDESKLSSIFYFPLFWNMFEKTCCGNNAKMNRHAPQLAQDYADKIEDVVGSVWTHYHNRYIQNSKPTPVFKSFTFRTGDNKQWVEAVLRKNGESSAVEKLEALLRIAFRLRNNLFHGEKDVSKLYAQNENFRQTNRLLITILDSTNKD